jgi:hypothetical protein
MQRQPGRPHPRNRTSRTRKVGIVALPKNRLADIQHSEGTSERPQQGTAQATLERVRGFVHQGKLLEAFHLSRELTKTAPDNVEAWLYCAVLANTDEQRFAYLSKALSLAPDHPRARRGVYKMLQHYLQQDPFLRYLEETERAYRVVTGEGRTLIVPKDRASAIVHPAIIYTAIQPVYRWLRYSVLGLPLAGLPTLVCASLAWILAWYAIYQTVGTTGFRRAVMALVYASVLWTLGFTFAFLLLLNI